MKVKNNRPYYSLVSVLLIAHRFLFIHCSIAETRWRIEVDIYCAAYIRSWWWRNWWWMTSFRVVLSFFCGADFFPLLLFFSLSLLFLRPLIGINNAFWRGWATKWIVLPALHSERASERERESGRKKTTSFVEGHPNNKEQQTRRHEYIQGGPHSRPHTQIYIPSS